MFPRSGVDAYLVRKREASLRVGSVNPPRRVSGAITLYPCSIEVLGHPASHGTADLMIDTNDVAMTRVVLTADLLVALHRQIGQKLSDIRLVSEVDR